MNWNSSTIENKIGLQFKNNKLLRLALIHPSYAQQINEPDETNERLAFLGKTILNLTCINYLYLNCPYLSITKWSQLQEKIVDEERLTKIWFNLGLGETCPFLGLKEDRYTLRQKKKVIFADAFFALIGAIYMDRGFAQVHTWISKKLIAPLLETHLKKDQERITPEKHLEFLGGMLLKAITADTVYRYLPHAEVKYLSVISKNMESKPLQEDYFQQLNEKDWLLIPLDLKENIKKSFKNFLGAVYLYFTVKINTKKYNVRKEKQPKNTLRETREWFVERFIDHEELLKDTITLMLKDNKPQKWIIRYVMGYESNKYQEGREKFHELMEEKNL
jgi:ribonuclease III